MPMIREVATIPSDLSYRAWIDEDLSFFFSSSVKISQPIDLFLSSYGFNRVIAFVFFLSMEFPCD